MWWKMPMDEQINIRRSLLNKFFYKSGSFFRISIFSCSGNQYNKCSCDHCFWSEVSNAVFNTRSGFSHLHIYTRVCSIKNMYLKITGFFSILTKTFTSFQSSDHHTPTVLPKWLTFYYVSMYEKIYSPDINVEAENF